MLEATLALIAGAIIGSFLTVVAHRLPRGESLLGPRSRCPRCGAPIAGRDNIPIASWLMLRGRCRHCGEAISARYPLIEIATATLFAGLVLARGVHPYLWVGLPFMALMVVVAAIDIERRIVPNKLLLPAAAWGLGASLVVQSGRVPELLISALAAGGLLLVAALVYPAGMGMGDVKLAGVMGLYLGRAVAPALLIGFFVGAVAGIAIMVREGRQARKKALPFAPFLAIGGAIAQLAGPEMVSWYLDSYF